MNLEENKRDLPLSFSKRFFEIFLFLLSLVNAFFGSWCRLLYVLCRKMLLGVGSLTPLQLLYGLACLIMIGASLRPWFFYHISFFSQEQAAFSSFRWFFFLSAFGMMLLLLFAFPLKKLCSLSLIAGTLGLYLYGFFGPIVHISMKKTEYVFSAAFWAYGSGLLMLLPVSFQVLRDPVISSKKWRAFLLTHPKL